MESLTHWKKMVNPKYLGSHDLFISDGKYSEVTVEITNVQVEEVIGENSKKDNCLVAHLKGMKPLIVNRTNAKTISKLAGSPAIEKWVGVQVILTVSKVKAFGQVHDAIRVKDQKPNVTPRDYSKQIEAINACADINALVQVWSGLDGDAKTACLAVKDSRKKQLEQSK
jgi:predicted RecB family endonuclease